MGCDRGTPIDRVFIERFLSDNSQLIQGNFCEIGDNYYTEKYSKSGSNSIIFTADASAEGSNIIIGDLQTGKGCITRSVDCFILTQTLPFMFDIHSAVQNIVSMLKPGGVALVTVGGISSISQYDYSRWGHFWGFTEKSLVELFERTREVECLEYKSYGNAKLASAFLYGLAKEDFEYNDKDVPVIISLIVKKKEK